VNPYRGCYHGCAYCYARPTHEYLDFGAGTDFERKLVVKRDIAALLQEAFDAPHWAGELVAFSGNTDCYQPLEASWGLTRSALEVCLRYRNPVGIVTKSTLIERDLALLVELARETHCVISVSIPFWNEEAARALEPYAPSPERRMTTLRRLAAAGLPVGINIAPVIPGLNDEDIPTLLREARNAGARFVGHTMLRLPGPVKTVFEERLRLLLPLRADKVMSQIRDARGGALNGARFGERMRGEGARWRVIEALFLSHKTRLGYEPMPPSPTPSPFRRPPRESGQLRLF
jgi:DNA repair photolyase